MSWTESTEPSPALLADATALRASTDALRRSTARADRTAAGAGVCLAYAAAGLAPPREIVWCDSPLAVVRARCERRAGAGPCVKSVVVDGVLRQVTRAVEAAMPRALRIRVWSVARLTGPATLSRGVQDAIETSLRTDQRDWPWRHSSWRQPNGWLDWIRGRRPREREMTFSDASFGQHDASSLAICRCLGQHGFRQQTAPLDGLWEVATSAGWMLPHERICWLSERPDTLRVDTQERLHAADGPALRFADGWSHYAWKGVRVPSWAIEDRHLINASLVNREHDPVLRRCMIDIMTPARYIESSDAICISRDETGELWLKSWHHWDSWAAVMVVNGTAEPDGSFKTYVLQVPPTMRSAREAVAWTYGLTEQEYARLRLRT